MDVNVFAGLKPGAELGCKGAPFCEAAARLQSACCLHDKTYERCVKQISFEAAWSMRQLSTAR
jgi:hypothetical protein